MNPRCGRLSVLVAAMTTLIAVVFALPAFAGAAAGPYRDPRAVGSIGLCDRSGHALTSGRIGTAPFAWRAVSSVAATAPYDGPGRTATLYAFQPRPGVAAAQWSGEALTAAAVYSNPAHPMAAATKQDEALASFINDFPPRWNGFIELRLVLGVPGEPADALSYPATDIQVVGARWHVVGGSDAPCHSGTSASLVTLLAPRSAATGGGGHATAPTGASVTPAADFADAASIGPAGSNGPSEGYIALTVIAALGAIGAVSVHVIRRRLAAPTQRGR